MKFIPPKSDFGYHKFFLPFKIPVLLEAVQVSQRHGNHNIWYSEHIKKDTETYQLELLRSSGPWNVVLRIEVMKN